jgi:hypothetical protein
MYICRIEIVLQVHLLAVIRSHNMDAGPQAPALIFEVLDKKNKGRINYNPPLTNTHLNYDIPVILPACSASTFPDP